MALDPEEETELRENFNHFDSDDNGVIDFNEFKLLLDTLGADMSDEEMEVGFDIVDANHNGQIDFGEFTGWWGAR